MATQTGKRIAQAGQWLRAGAMSAAVIKPVVDQMMSKRTSAKAVASQASDLRTRLEDQLPLTQQQIEKLAKSISDRMADLSDQAQFAAKRVIRRADNVDGRIWWATGITLGFAAAGVTAFVVTRRRMAAQSQAEDLVALPQPTENGHLSPTDRLRSAVSRITQRPATPPSDTAASPMTAATAVAENDRIIGLGTALANEAQFVGNIKTLIFHRKDSDHLPAEENRIYFRNEQEAEGAGYRAATGE